MSLHHIPSVIEPQAEGTMNLTFKNSTNHDQQHIPTLNPIAQITMASEQTRPLSQKLTPSSIDELHQTLIKIPAVTLDNMPQPAEERPVSIALAHYKPVKATDPASVPNTAASSLEDLQWFQGLPISCSAYDYNELCHSAIRSIREHYSEPTKGYYITNIRIIWSYVEETISAADVSPQTELKELLAKEIYDSLILMQERKWRDYMVVEFCGLEPLVTSILANVSKMEVGVLNRPRVEPLIDTEGGYEMEWEGDESARGGPEGVDSLVSRTVSNLQKFTTKK